MDRKKFLATSVLGALSVATYGMVKFSEPKNAFEGDCRTTSDILGPFYRKGSPERSDMTMGKGNIVTIKGVVFDGCEKSISGAKVEIWHANADGQYDNDSSEFVYRSMQISNKNGAYSFKTEFPGKYLNGKMYRPAHVHIRVTAPGERELVSQLYFQGDPHIENDPWASNPTALKRILTISPVSISGDFEVEFDINL